MTNSKLALTNLLWARGSVARWPDFKMAAPKRLHGDFKFITGKRHLAASKSTGSSLYKLPQYTVAPRVSKNNSKVAYLKRSKSRISSSCFFSTNLNARSDAVKMAIDRE